MTTHNSSRLITFGFCLLMLLSMLIAPSCSNDKNTRFKTDKDGDKDKIIIGAGETPSPQSLLRQNHGKSFAPSAKTINSNGTETITLNYSEAYVQKLNVVWVMDNGPSMKNSNLHTLATKEFQNFVNTYAGNENTNIGLITATSENSQRCGPSRLNDINGYDASGGAWYMNLSQNAKKQLHITDCLVESTLPLAALNRMFSHGVFSEHTNVASYLDPHGFNAFVVVSDHVSLQAYAEEFVSHVNRNFHPNLVSFYSFSSGATHNSRGSNFTVTVANQGQLTRYQEPGLQSTCGSFYSSTYQDLSTHLSGERFDICEPSWINHTQTIVQASLQKHTQSLPLHSLDRHAHISQVRLDGKSLSSKDYDIVRANPPLLVIKNPLITLQKSPSSSIEVTYTPSR